MSLSLRPDEEAMVIDWSLPVALSFADTLAMCLETITAVSVVDDEQTNVSTHFTVIHRPMRHHVTMRQ